ncbi:hypothetical protein ACOME3_009153 [Neoechinorhynchus agilis]
MHHPYGFLKLGDPNFQEAARPRYKAFRPTIAVAPLIGCVVFGIGLGMFALYRQTFVNPDSFKKKPVLDPWERFFTPDGKPITFKLVSLPSGSDKHYRDSERPTF